MSIIEDVFARAGLTEVKVGDLRPGDKFILWEPDNDAIYEGTTDRIDGDNLHCQDGPSLWVYEVQTWYLVERAPVEEPTGWGAIVEVNGMKYASVPISRFNSSPWSSEEGESYDWAGINEHGVPKVLFEGISE